VRAAGAVRGVSGASEIVIEVAIELEFELDGTLTCSASREWKKKKWSTDRQEYGSL
jgi:hypothetical protein